MIDKIYLTSEIEQALNTIDNVKLYGKSGFDKGYKKALQDVARHFKVTLESDLEKMDDSGSFFVWNY